jgi:hypothetical protein
MSTTRIWLAVLVAALTTASANEVATEGTSGAPRYTFSWPLESGAPKPRGGTTKGAPITLETSASREWRALQEPGLSSFERDRRAILAMAGDYRVTFDFLEVASFGSGQARQAPYQSWGTEKVYVDSDSGSAISLVHILEMRIVQADGKISGPMVTKHWRQDWQYEPKHMVEYRGRDRWERRKVAAVDAKGAWLQTVYQVDESPRYSSIGMWQHSSSFSTWLSGETWRPLPRREWSVREDYQILLGTNRHSVFATGWTQEENNLKTALTPERALRKEQPHLAREYGIARYERMKDADFAAADKYYAATRQFWDEVRDQWADAFADQGTITLRGPVDKLGLFMPLFAHASAIEEGKATADSGAVIRNALRDMGALR